MRGSLKSGSGQLGPMSMKQRGNKFPFGRIVEAEQIESLENSSDEEDRHRHLSISTGAQESFISQQLRLIAQSRTPLPPSSSLFHLPQINHTEGLDMQTRISGAGAVPGGSHSKLARLRSSADPLPLANRDIHDAMEAQPMPPPIFQNFTVQANSKGPLRLSAMRSAEVLPTLSSTVLGQGALTSSRAQLVTSMEVPQQSRNRIHARQAATQNELYQQPVGAVRSISCQTDLTPSTLDSASQTLSPSMKDQGAQASMTTASSTGCSQEFPARSIEKHPLGEALRVVSLQANHGQFSQLHPGPDEQPRRDSQASMMLLLNDLSTKHGEIINVSNLAELSQQLFLQPRSSQFLKPSIVEMEKFETEINVAESISNQPSDPSDPKKINVEHADAEEEKEEEKKQDLIPLSNAGEDSSMEMQKLSPAKSTPPNIIFGSKEMRQLNDHSNMTSMLQTDEDMCEDTDFEIADDDVKPLQQPSRAVSLTDIEQLDESEIPQAQNLPPAEGKQDHFQFISLGIESSPSHLEKETPRLVGTHSEWPGIQTKPVEIAEAAERAEDDPVTGSARRGDGSAVARRKKKFDKETLIIMNDILVKLRQYLKSKVKRVPRKTTPMKRKVTFSLAGDASMMDPPSMDPSPKKPDSRRPSVTVSKLTEQSSTAKKIPPANQRRKSTLQAPQGAAGEEQKVLESIEENMSLSSTNSLAKIHPSAKVDFLTLQRKYKKKINVPLPPDNILEESELQQLVKKYEKEYVKLERISPILPKIKPSELSRKEVKWHQRRIDEKGTRIRRRDIGVHKKIGIRIFQKLEFQKSLIKKLEEAKEEKMRPPKPTSPPKIMLSKPRSKMNIKRTMTSIQKRV